MTTYSPRIRCKVCKAHYVKRVNLLNGKDIWQPDCKHSIDDHEVSDG